MKTSTFRSVCVAARFSASVLVLAGTPAFAQDANSQPLMKDSKGDTLHMTCEHARSLVHGAGGTILTSGPYHTDLYHIAGGTCEHLSEDKQPAFVRSNDNPLCFVGYTCEARTSNTGSN